MKIGTLTEWFILGPLLPLETAGLLYRRLGVSPAEKRRIAKVRFFPWSATVAPDERDGTAV